METTSSTPAHTPALAVAADGPSGLGGWLILPILHLVTTVLLSGYNLLLVTQNWEGIVALATGQLDSSYQWLVWPITISLVMGVGVVAFAIYLLVILFQKKRELPGLMVWFYFVLLAVTLVESGMIFQYVELRESSADVGQAGKDLARAVIAAVIWIPYFLRSKRVQATFVN